MSSVWHERFAEDTVRSLDPAHQVRMANLVLAGWTIKARDGFAERWTAKAPYPHNNGAEYHYGANTLMTLLDSIPELEL